MSWASRRQSFILFLVLGVLVLGLFLHFRPMLFKVPSCTDGKQNADEVGVDCGGGCINFCRSQIKEPIVLWSRAFPVTESVYNAVAYIENQNNAAISSIPYEFRLYDEKGGFVARVQGETLIQPLGRYALVETGIKVGNTSSIGRTTFEFGEPSVPWLRVPESIAALRTSVTDIELTDANSAPKLSAKLINRSPTVTLSNTTVAALLFDARDNAINVSRTYVETLHGGESVPIFFTWPRPLSAPVVRYELIPILDIFHVKK